MTKEKDFLNIKSTDSRVYQLIGMELTLKAPVRWPVGPNEEPRTHSIINIPVNTVFKVKDVNPGYIILFIEDDPNLCVRLWKRNGWKISKYFNLRYKKVKVKPYGIKHDIVRKIAERQGMV